MGAARYVGRVGGLAVDFVVGNRSSNGLTRKGIGTPRRTCRRTPANSTVRPFLVPVILDGKTRSVTVSMEGIAYTMDPGETLTLQSSIPPRPSRTSRRSVSSGSPMSAWSFRRRPAQSPQRCPPPPIGVSSARRTWISHGGQQQDGAEPLGGAGTAGATLEPRRATGGRRRAGRDAPSPGSGVP
jgi:hypothetical protein